MRRCGMIQPTLRATRHKPITGSVGRSRPQTSRMYSKTPSEGASCWLKLCSRKLVSIQRGSIVPRTHCHRRRNAAKRCTRTLGASSVIAAITAVLMGLAILVAKVAAICARTSRLTRASTAYAASRTMLSTTRLLTFSPASARHESVHDLTTSSGPSHHKIRCGGGRPAAV